MLTFTLTVFLAASVFPGRASLTVAPTCRVKGHPGAELTLHCGDGENEGLVRFWHTPFGDLQTSTGDLDPVFLDPDGGLVVPNASALHSGVYYCVRQHAEGTALWPYELHVGHHDENPRGPRQEPCGTPRARRDAGSEETREGDVSDGAFAAAVAASVLLTFVVGFSAGALTRTPVLRCLVAVRSRLPWQRRRQTATPVSGSAVTMTTLPPMYENQAWDEENCTSADTTMSTPPAKPQRSFRRERQEASAAPYLEGCGYGTEEEEEEEGGSRKEEEGGSVKEEEVEGGNVKEEEEEGSQSDEDERGDGVVEEATQESEEEGSEKEEVETGSGDGETGSRKQDAAVGGRRSRVIRLYQYDEDGRRYGHLQDSAPSEPGPAPMMKQRSLSLTRLSSIMAAASGPLDTRETGEREEGERERTYFHIQI